MTHPALEDLEAAAAVVYQHLQPSPLLQWPLLSRRCGCEVWLKHENHNPTGAFKVRGGLVYMHHLKQREPDCAGVVTATRGNHGQSVALAAARNGLQAVIVVPEGNSADKNRAMQALGAELVVHGRDFDESVLHARALAAERGLHAMPSFHQHLVQGVASYALEMFRAQPVLERVYVPIGLGSGICGVVAAREALGLAVEVVGVVSTGADCYRRSFAAGECISTDTADTLADGMAVRVPNADALAAMQAGVSRVVAVDDAAVLEAMACLFTDTHNVAEGAGAAAVAALLQEREHNRGARLAAVLTGGNVDAVLYARALKAGGI